MAAVTTGTPPPEHVCVPACKLRIRVCWPHYCYHSLARIHCRTCWRGEGCNAGGTMTQSLMFFSIPETAMIFICK